jgi:hypothetical protein
MVKRQLHVEGGGDSKSSFLASECRKAFSKLLEKAGVPNKPRVIVCGGRASAYASFCSALKSGGTEDWLLVDAEDVVPSGPPFDPWAHVLNRAGDRWARPDGASDAQLHLMAVCTETWLIADPAALRQVFGPKLDVTKLPPANAALETIDKPRIMQSLAQATKPTKAAYDKGNQQFKVLALVSPSALRVMSWAKRFLDEMR